MEKQHSPIVSGVLSTLVPGLGQVYAGERYRGTSVLFGFVLILGAVAWYAHPIWYAAPIIIWLWNIWDAMTLASQGRTRPLWIPLLAGLIATYSIGWQVVQIDFSNADMNRAYTAVLRPMLTPDFIQPKKDQKMYWVEIQVPCLDNPPSGHNELDGVSISIEPNCAAVSEPVTVSATGLWPDTDTEVWWEDSAGQEKMVAPGEASMLVVRADAQGNMTAHFKVPTSALIAVPDVTKSPPHRVYLRQSHLLGGYELSFVGSEVTKGALVTVGMALLATILAMLFAIPLSFLAARNLMSRNPLTFAIYVVVRTLLNILRSIESLIIAIVFVVIVGLGPFAGMLALAVHSIAALAKLYSEVIEGIDPGPIEAIRATGANWVQVVRYGVIPQIVPPFTAFTIYRWDINVRSATIVGFVGGGGLGFLAIELIRVNNMHGLSTVFIAIAVIVMAMDYVSAKIRERLI